jgi:hypothetical protein
MKKSREHQKAEYMKEAEELFDELMDWSDENEAPNMTQIEDIVLKLRKRFGEQIAQSVIQDQEQRQPAERVYCPQCGEEMGPKGMKGNHVETRIGRLKIEREHHYCPQCKQGIFPPRSAVDDLGKTLE